MKIHNQSTLAIISAERKKLNNPYAFLDENGHPDTIIIHKAASNEAPLVHNTKTRHQDIENIARDLQLEIWNNRNLIWPNGVPSDPVDLLDPAAAVKHIGYEYEQSDFLGEYYNKGKKTETAGMIDRPNKRISISNRLPVITHRFTAAHELGHAMLHNMAVMHRDYPIESQAQSSDTNNPIETEANKFAAAYLMPAKLLRDRFITFFGTEVFILNEETAYALDPKNSSKLLTKCKSTRETARTLAKTTHYNGIHFRSLADQFKVSNEAIAIRLEELGLIK